MSVPFESSAERFCLFQENWIVIPERLPVYFEIQRMVALIEEALVPRATTFNPTQRLANELRRLLAGVPPEAVPQDLHDALSSGAAVGPAAAQWLSRVREWLAYECARTQL